MKKPEIGFQYLYITNAIPAIANAIQPRGDVSKVKEKARKATIAVLIIEGIARKPFLNAVKLLIILFGIAFKEVMRLLRQMDYYLQR